MSVVTFLSKLGADIVKGAAIVSGLAPIAELALPGEATKIQTVSNDFTEFANLVVQAEAIGQQSGLTGPQKAAAIAPLLAQAVLKSAPFAGKKIANQQKFITDVATFAGSIADLLNDVSADAVQTQSVT